MWNEQSRRSFVVDILRARRFTWYLAAGNFWASLRSDKGEVLYSLLLPISGAFGTVAAYFVYKSYYQALQVRYDVVGINVLQLLEPSLLVVLASTALLGPSILAPVAFWSAAKHLRNAVKRYAYRRFTSLLLVLVCAGLGLLGPYLTLTLWLWRGQLNFRNPFMIILGLVFVLAVFLPFPGALYLVEDKAKRFLAVGVGILAGGIWINALNTAESVAASLGVNGRPQPPAIHLGRRDPPPLTVRELARIAHLPKDLSKVLLTPKEIQRILGSSDTRRELMRNLEQSATPAADIWFVPECFAIRQPSASSTETLRAIHQPVLDLGSGNGTDFVTI